MAVAGGFERPVDMLEDRARLIEVAVVDEGRAGPGARHRAVLGDEAVARVHAGVEADVGGGRAGGGVERRDLGAHGSQDRPVGGAGEHVDAVVGEVGGRIDGARGGEGLGAGEQRRGVRLAQGRLHAAVERQVELALGAAVRSAGDDAGALDRARERDVELARHVGAGRQARDRGLGEVNPQRGERVGGAGRVRCPREQRRERQAAPDGRHWPSSFLVRRSKNHAAGAACAEGHRAGP